MKAFKNYFALPQGFPATNFQLRDNLTVEHYR
jgi:hypothetical protein